MTAVELITWMKEKAFPFWAQNGVDRITGGFFELLDHGGRPIERPRRARLTARQIYCFAMADMLVPDAGYDLFVGHGLDFLLRHIVTTEGKVISSVSPDGKIIAPGPDLYDDAFVLFALAHVPDPHGDIALLAQKIATGMLNERGRSDGAFRDPGKPLLANPMMHLLEAFIAWWGVTSDPFWKKLAEGIVRCAYDRMIQPGLKMLPEVFSPNWDPLPDSEGLVIEPGHQYEWGWLLARWARQTNQPDLFAVSINIARTAEQHGLLRRNGCVVNTLNERCEVRDDKAKLWPQAERAKFWHEVLGHPFACASEQIEAELLRDAAIASLQSFWQDVPDGVWREVRLLDGSFIDEPVRASSLYHIVCAGMVTDSSASAIFFRKALP